MSALFIISVGMETKLTYFFYGIAFLDTIELVYQYPRAGVIFGVIILLGLLSKTVRASIIFFIFLKFAVEVFSLKAMRKLGKIIVDLWGNMTIVN